jgi:hypothetical protein
VSPSSPTSARPRSMRAPSSGHVFLTLIKNALDHAHGLTHITISAERAEPDLVVACEDDCPGIPGAERKTLFDRGHGRNGIQPLACRGDPLYHGASIRETGRVGGGASSRSTSLPGCGGPAGPADQAISWTIRPSLKIEIFPPPLREDECRLRS